MRKVIYQLQRIQNLMAQPLNNTAANETKLILHTISDLKGNISEFYADGISLGYKTAEENYNDEIDNSVVMIRVDKKAENEIVNIE